MFKSLWQLKCLVFFSFFLDLQIRSPLTTDRVLRILETSFFVLIVQSHLILEDLTALCVFCPREKQRFVLLNS